MKILNNTQNDNAREKKMNRQLTNGTFFRRKKMFYSF